MAVVGMVDESDVGDTTSAFGWRKRRKYTKINFPDVDANRSPSEYEV
jgi:hypothetical protein